MGAHGPGLEPLADREADAVFELRRRLRRLRSTVLVPLAVGSATLAVPAYLLLRTWQYDAQWSAGAWTAYHVPLVTGALAMIPAGLAFAVAVSFFRRLRDRRLREWKRELCRAHALPEGHLDEQGQIFH